MPEIIVTYLILDRLIFRSRVFFLRLQDTVRPEYYSIEFAFLGQIFSHFLFWWGGFYDQFWLPQFILIALSLYELAINLIRNKKKKDISFDIKATIFNFIFITVLLTTGHFYDKLNFIFF